MTTVPGDVLGEEERLINARQRGYIRYVLGVTTDAYGEPNWQIYCLYEYGDSYDWSGPVLPGSARLDEFRADIGKISLACAADEYLELRSDPPRLMRLR